MTIFDASVKLYAWFAEHDSFCVDTDEKKLLEDCSRKKYRRKEELAAINCSLAELKSMDMIDSHLSADGQETWVLKKSFDTLNQSVQLTSETCLSISAVVTGFCDIVGNTTDKPDPKNINEADVKNLLFICSHLMDTASKNSSEEVDGPEDLIK